MKYSDLTEAIENVKYAIKAIESQDFDFFAETKEAFPENRVLLSQQSIESYYVRMCSIDIPNPP